jgi:DNA-binding response OmpR family regulator
MTVLEFLIVEDDPTLGPLLGELLEELGFHVGGIARTTREAVELAITLRPDCMIVDARLGSGSGLAAVMEINCNRNIPYIIMSGGPVDGPVAAPVLAKPFSQGQLESAIRQAMMGNANTSA